MDWYFKLVIGCLIFLLLYGLARNFTGCRGSWSQRLPPIYDALPPSDLDRSHDSVGEQRVRAFLERYFGRRFAKVRPFFLENAVTGNNLELDCYNSDLKLAAEYNGRQHYEYTPYFHANKEAFYNQRYRDELKRIYCRDHGILLITIPYTEKSIEEHLFNKLEELYKFSDVNKDAKDEQESDVLRA